MPVDRISSIIGTAGHIDHGKTSLVKALTGIDTDRLAEEKRRGLTIDLGFAHIDFESEGAKVRAAIVDVPGHERFIKNMLAGVTGIDLVLFVVAADDGVMPQTIEHFDIVRLLGVKKGIFALTKIDLVDGARQEEAKKEIEGLIKGTQFEGSPIVAVSAETNEGMDGLKKVIKDNIMRLRRRCQGPFFRLPVDRSFTIKGFGAVVTGTVASGSVEKGAELALFPTGVRVRVKGIQSLYLEADRVYAGQRAAINISGTTHTEVKRGAVLAAADMGFCGPGSPGGRFFVDCTFDFLPKREDSKKDFIRNRGLVKVHHLTDETLAVIQFQDKKDASPGGAAQGRLVLRRPMLMLRGDRFILRDPSVNGTIGGGAVLWPHIERWSSGRPAVEVPEEALNCAEGALKFLLRDRAGMRASLLSLMLNMSEADLKGTVKGMPDFAEAGPFVISLKRFEALKERGLALLKDHHGAHPTEAGMKEDDLFKKIKKDISTGLAAEDVSSLFKVFLDHMISGSAAIKEGAHFRLALHCPAAGGRDAKIEEAITALLSKGFSAPAADELNALPFDRKDVSRVLAYLQKSGGVVKLKEGVYLSGEAIRTAKEGLTAFIKARGNIRASEFRDILGCGRKLAIEILEYFDKERVTLRKGDIRILRQ